MVRNADRQQVAKDELTPERSRPAVIHCIISFFLFPFLFLCHDVKAQPVALGHIGKVVFHKTRQVYHQSLNWRKEKKNIDTGVKVARS